MKEQPLYIGGQEVMTEKTVPVYNKETNETIAEIAVAGEAECRTAVDAAEKAFREFRRALRDHPQGRQPHARAHRGIRRGAVG